MTHRLSVATGIVVSTLALLAVLTAPTAAQTDTCQDPRHTFTVNGTAKSVDVAWCGPDHFGGANSTVVAHAEAGGDTVHANRGHPHPMSNRVLLHELGHTLGYTHDDAGRCVDCGVMNYSAPDVEECGLDEPTRTIAETYAGYRVIDWDTADVRYLIGEWANGTMDTRHVLYAIEHWANRSPCETVYYSSNFDRFGGYYDSEPVTVLGFRVHQHAGYFYGLPVLDRQLRSFEDAAR